MIRTSARPPKLRSRECGPPINGSFVQRRTFFGVGEIVNVLANPSEVVRNLTESRKLLEEARQDLRDMKERSQMPPKHTFSPLPGFFERKAELTAIERALSGVPSFTVLFGASSVGKTALCRQVLTRPEYHVLHFDLRIAGFADLASLYFALASQMEQYFIELSKRLEGYEEFEKESYAFKHDRIGVEKRVENGGEVKTSDVAHVLELFQSALLKYWSFEPPTKEVDQEETGAEPGKHGKEATLKQERGVEETKEAINESQEPKKPEKLVPVIFFDEAHRLPLLIRDRKAMKCILDAMLVLTKQDRLIHVIHATSDAFYLQHVHSPVALWRVWLRQLNVMQHCKIMAVGDASKEEAREYFEKHLLPEVPEKLRTSLTFDRLYPVFGGKLAHISDYVADYVNADGQLSPTQSSHYAQAHALLNLQLIHASPSLSAPEGDETEGQAAGFGIYSPLRAVEASADSQAQAPGHDFTPKDLLDVCRRLLKEKYLSYFPLCREMGAKVVDGLIRARILELRWVESITPEEGIDRSSHDQGPILLPTTPVMRSAMKQVVSEWDDFYKTQST
ncbi:hypothetical protein P389DRAFT_205468 [Cystobasidium minutum MCA 4210]|uniref:uncharacterized protein n=1 Tax=Cystobasidium minutum MCA 4210 TaxID=1397322 RepID=UPI0034CFCBA0|eukprot:jgi/Rhomi1/205468/MIX6297_710_28